MKAALLSRVSAGHQDLDQQTTKVKDFALRDGYREEDLIIIEDVESAVKLSEEERNGLNKLKDIILHDSEVNCVYTYEISRISRQAKIVYSIRDFLIEHHIQLVVLNPLFRMLKDDGTLSESSNIFFGIFASMAENEGFIRKARIAKAKDKYKKMGRHCGGNQMFGYTINKNKQYIIHEDNADIVREIFDMYVNDRMSIRKIAKELHERGVQMWTCDTERKPTTYLTMCQNVNNILHRKEYYGDDKFRPAIITKELFDAAQSIMKNRIISDYKKDVHAVLKGLLRDSNSKFLLSANPSSKYYYSKRVKGANISWSCADEVICQWCNDKMEEWTIRETSNMMREIKKENDILLEKQKNADKRINEIHNSLDILEERIVKGRISSTLAEKLENELNSELESIVKDLIDYKVQIRLLKIKANLLKNEDKIKITKGMNVDDKHNIIKKMIDTIYVSRPSRFVAHLEIHPIIGEVENIIVDTFHKKIIG